MSGEQLNSMTPAKPPFGAQCNGCGICCAIQPCKLAVDLLGATVGPCSAMEFDAGRFWCGLVRSPGRYLNTPEFGNELLSETIARSLGVSKGCDADDGLDPALAAEPFEAASEPPNPNA